MITPPTVRVSYIILSITLTVILISSPIIAVYSPSVVLKVGFTSAAYATSENNDDDNNEAEEEQPTTDATTDGEEEVDGDGGDVQQEDNTEEEQQPSSSTQEQEELDEDRGEEEEEQLAFMAGEICDDFEDNDGDGFIDLVDADCVAPLTQGTVTAPTTPPPTSVTNTTATNSTANTLTAAGIAGLDRPYDLEKDCKTYEELGIPDPPLEPGDPPNVQWYDCPPGVGVRVPPRAADTTTTTTTTSGVEICNDFEDNDGDGFIDLVDADCVAPLTQGTVTAPTTPTTPPLQSPPPPTTTTPQEPPQQEPAIEICNDFEDNDGDGFIDLGDADCVAPATQDAVTASTPTTTTNPDGSTTTAYPEGVVVTKYPDGISIFENGRPRFGDPSSPVYIPGLTLTTYPGRAVVWEHIQGNFGAMIPGFGSVVINPDGTSKFCTIEIREEERRFEEYLVCTDLVGTGTQLLVFLMLQHLEMHSRS